MFWFPTAVAVLVLYECVLLAVVLWMDFETTLSTLRAFMHEHIYPNEQLFAKECRDIGHRSNEWTTAPVLTKLQKIAQAKG